jgi:broad specificity phosphatase PhoE
MSGGVFPSYNERPDINNRIFVRHGESPQNTNEVDPNDYLAGDRLTLKGEVQADALGQALLGFFERNGFAEGSVVVVCSPAHRATQTVEGLNKHIHPYIRNIQQNPLLVEYGMRVDYLMTLYKNIANHPRPVANDEKQFFGEKQDFEERVRAVVRDIGGFEEMGVNSRAYPISAVPNLLIVSHGNILSKMYPILTGNPGVDPFWKNCQARQLILKNGEFVDRGVIHDGSLVTNQHILEYNKQRLVANTMQPQGYREYLKSLAAVYQTVENNIGSVYA